MTRTLLLGLDGITFDMLDPYLDAGDMPNLQRLMENGSVGPLTSTMPPVTGSAWHSLATGQHPGSTGIYDFIYRADDDGYDFRYMDSSKYRGKAVWDLFDGDETVGVVDYPTLNPPYSVNGFMTSGGLGASGRSSIPSDLNDELTQYPAPEPHLDLRDDEYEDLTVFMEDLFENLQRRKQILSHCIENKEWDLLWAVVQEPDWLQHMMWHVFDDTHERAYETTKELEELLGQFWIEIDDFVGRSMEAIDDDTNFVIMSDHGFGPLHNRVLRLNTWLKNEGYFTPKMLGSSQYWVKKRIRNTLASIASSIDLQRYAPQLFQWGKDKTASFAIQLNAVDLEKTILFDPGHIGSMGGLYLNEGGLAPSQNPEQVVEEVREKLISLSEEHEISINTYIPEEMYGTKAPGSPDLIVRIEGGLIEDGGWDRPIFDNLPERLSHQTGSHRRDGVLVATGPDFEQGTIEDAYLWDLAPTILHVHERAVPSWMDGRVMTDILTFDRAIDRTDGSVSEMSGDTLSDEEREQMQEQLSDLGYFE